MLTCAIPVVTSSYALQATAGLVDMCGTLLQSRANPDASTVNGATALIRGAAKGYTDVVKLLLSHGATVDQAAASSGSTALMVAADRGHADGVMRLLINANANVNLGTAVAGDTALMAAAGAGHGKVVKFLLENGAQTNLVNGDGQTAAELADVEALGSKLAAKLAVVSPTAPALLATVSGGGSAGEAGAEDEDEDEFGGFGFGDDDF